MITEEDREELMRRSSEMWNRYGAPRSWDIHEINRFLGGLRYAIEEGKPAVARKFIKKAMAHGLPADDMLAKVEEGLLNTLLQE